MNEEVVTNKISPRQLRALLPLIWQSGHPANIIGKTGLGKTTAVDFLAQAIKTMLVAKKVVGAGYKTLYTVYTAGLPAEDVGGLPVRNELTGKAETLAFSSLPFDRPVEEQHECILFLDEIDRCGSSETLSMIQNLILTREVHGHTLDSKVFIATAMNGSTDTETRELTDALIGRLIHLYVCGSAPDFQPSFAKWVKEEGKDERLIAFRQSCPPPNKPLHQLAMDEDRKRVWASDLWALASKAGLDDALKAHLVYGCIGETAGRAFIQTWMKPSKQDLLAMSADALKALDPKMLGDCIRQYRLGRVQAFMALVPAEIKATIESRG